MTDLRWVKARVLLDLERYDDADALCNELDKDSTASSEQIELFREQISQARAIHREQEKQLYRKMLNKKMEDVADPFEVAEQVKEQKVVEEIEPEQVEEVVE